MKLKKLFFAIILLSLFINVESSFAYEQIIAGDTPEIKYQKHLKNCTDTGGTGYDLATGKCIGCHDPKSVADGDSCVSAGDASYLAAPVTGGQNDGSGSNQGANTRADIPGLQISDDKIPGVTEGTSEIIKCGRAGQNMCTLCDLIAGLNYIIKYLMKIAVGVALLAMTIGGVMYVVSFDNKDLTGKAKSAIENAAIGFVIIFAGYLIINTTISYIGSRKDVNGNPTFGMTITSWGNFDCTAGPR